MLDVAPEDRLIGSIRLLNVRSFVDVELPLNRTTVVIGRNGTNKTTLLRCLALGMTYNEQDRAALFAMPGGNLHRLAADRGSIGLWVAGGAGGRITNLPLLPDTPLADQAATPQGGSAHMVNMVHMPSAVFGYGVVRGLIGGDAHVGGGFSNVRSLFDYRHEMLEPELTLRRMKDHVGEARYEAALRRFLGVLGLGDGDGIRWAKGGGLEVSGPGVGGTVQFHAWADGYRLTLSWLIDLYGRAMQTNGAIDDDGHILGVVLVDEIEQHLHPSLQLTVMRRLREALPKAQLIVTTHSLLVALGVAPEELVVLRRSGDEVIVEPHVLDYRFMSAEDVLTHENLFATEAVSEEAQRVRVRYDELVATAVRTPDEDEELAALANRLRSAADLFADSAFVDAFAELARRLGP